jgi:hypothetical protein
MCRTGRGTGLRARRLVIDAFPRNVMVQTRLEAGEVSINAAMREVLTERSSDAGSEDVTEFRRAQ